MLEITFSSIISIIYILQTHWCSKILTIIALRSGINEDVSFRADSTFVQINKKPLPSGKGKLELSMLAHMNEKDAKKLNIISDDRTIEGGIEELNDSTGPFMRNSKLKDKSVNYNP